MGNYGVLVAMVSCCRFGMVLWVTCPMRFGLLGKQGHRSIMPRLDECFRVSIDALDTGGRTDHERSYLEWCRESELTRQGLTFAELGTELTTDESLHH